MGYPGANVLIQAAILKYHHCLPYRKIRELFQELAGITVSPGGLSPALARVSHWLGIEKAVLLDAIRGAEAHGTIMSLMQTLRLQGKKEGFLEKETYSSRKGLEE